MADATPPMTPGSYLRKRRTAAGLSIEQVAASIATDPRLHEIDRCAWLRLIEDDVTMVTVDIAAALLRVFRFDPDALRQLIHFHAFHSFFSHEVMLCRICGCSQRDPCWDETTASACAWASPGICTACATSDKLEESANA